MSDYRQKYLKYKNKYLKLKQIQKGGLGPFYVYTTGIGYTSGDTLPNDRTGVPQLINLWNERLRARILELLPQYVNQIHFSHHDILINEIDDTFPTVAEQERMVQTFNELLQMPDMTSDDRVVSSVFTSEPLNFEQVQSTNSLVIDFAHIFRYDRNTVKRVFVGQTPYNISSIYLGFLGENYNENGFRRWNLIDIPMFNVEPDYQIDTYIDKFIRLDYQFDVENPQDFFANKIRQFKRQMEPIWRDLHQGSIAGFDDVFNLETNVRRFFDFLCELIFYSERDITEPEIIPLMMREFRELTN